MHLVFYIYCDTIYVSKSSSQNKKTYNVVTASIKVIYNSSHARTDCTKITVFRNTTRISRGLLLQPYKNSNI